MHICNKNNEWGRRTAFIPRGIPHPDDEGSAGSPGGSRDPKSLRTGHFALPRDGLRGLVLLGVQEAPPQGRERGSQPSVPPVKDQGQRVEPTVDRRIGVAVGAVERLPRSHLALGEELQRGGLGPQVHPTQVHPMEDQVREESISIYYLLYVSCAHIMNPLACVVLLISRILYTIQRCGK